MYFKGSLLAALSSAFSDTIKVSPGKETIGKVTSKQVEEIAKLKLPDLNTNSMAQAIKSIRGTARSMGIAIEG